MAKVLTPALLGWSFIDHDGEERFHQAIVEDGLCCAARTANSSPGRHDLHVIKDHVDDPALVERARLRHHHSRLPQRVPTYVGWESRGHAG